VEAVLQQVGGVLSIESGFMGGHVEDPSYAAVCAGETGHVEVVHLTFDPDRIAYADLLAWFWKLHDPTSLNRQGNDVGTQYRSAIFYHSEEQRKAAEASRALAAAAFSRPIVTEIAQASTFYAAKQEHQDYYRRNREQSYCQFVIAPKLDKLGLKK
jgi:peptide-methionine (S)-S-oxide reductase